MIERSKNENLVLYEAHYSDADKKVLDASKPVHEYWLRCVVRPCAAAEKLFEP